MAGTSRQRSGKYLDARYNGSGGSAIAVTILKPRKLGCIGSDDPRRGRLAEDGTTCE
ncbi:hypothetical protein RHECNPAF_5640010 [Rhizobium etli CNPAF512]|nr:hypothetical protein RHECNPAF_5640010 [Rhizobium etli CNPAF512]